MRWTAEQLPRLSGWNVIVTGANSGIGLPTAAELAKHGARVVLACRDLERGTQARNSIRDDDASADVEVAALDLASMSSVRKFAEGWTGPLDLLVNNAGVLAPAKPTRTADGFELQFGTNHLGHFALTGLLLPALLQAADPRVVTVSSLAHFGGREDVVDGNTGLPYRAQQAYSNSKLANLLFALELQRRATARGVRLTSTAAHPGMSATGLVSSSQGMGANPVIRTVAPLVLRVVLQSAAAGAEPTLFAATVAAPGSYSGPQWLGQSRGPVGPARMSDLACDERLGRRLWDVSEELTGLRYPWPSSP